MSSDVFYKNITVDDLTLLCITVDDLTLLYITVDDLTLLYITVDNLTLLYITVDDLTFPCIQPAIRLENSHCRTIQYVSVIVFIF